MEKEDSDCLLLQNEASENLHVHHNILFYTKDRFPKISLKPRGLAGGRTFLLSGGAT
jgi:hypothetical protein